VAGGGVLAVAAAAAAVDGDGDSVGNGPAAADANPDFLTALMMVLQPMAERCLEGCFVGLR